MTRELKAFGYSRDDKGRPVVRETVRPREERLGTVEVVLPPNPDSFPCVYSSMGGPDTETWSTGHEGDL